MSRRVCACGLEQFFFTAKRMNKLNGLGLNKLKGLGLNKHFHQILTLHFTFLNFNLMVNI